MYKGLNLFDKKMYADEKTDNFQNMTFQRKTSICQITSLETRSNEFTDK